MINAKLIVAIDEDNGIGKNNTIPWYHPCDMKFFKEKTMESHLQTMDEKGPINKSILLCGGNTMDSLRDKTLKNRHMLVLSKRMTEDYPLYTIPGINFDPSEIGSARCIEYNNDKAVLVRDHGYINSQLLDFFCSDEVNCDMFIIGGASIYSQALDDVFTNINITDAYVTKIPGKHECDTFFDYDKVKDKFILEGRTDISGDGSVIVEHWIK